MDNARQQIVDSIKANSNVLVTVSTDPTVDELSAALGLTILLDKLEKRATAVFSGAIPSAINFLEPDKTFENSADSLRDFIIALDKEKADHLRYKVDGDVVKIFITPYKTTLTQKDLDFSQGEFNVELVVAIGVKDQDHLDKALAAHGKILHDATVVTVTVGDTASTLGSTDWHEGTASSLSELMVSLADGLKVDKPVLDEQIATAFLTGIVSATDRFSNDRTSSRVMTMAAQLMAAGANQQLIAAKLEEAHDIAPKMSGATSQDSDTSEKKPTKDSATELSIDRSEKSKDTTDDSVVNEALEASAQKELEESLADLTGIATPTMADIESQLKDTSKPEDSSTPDTTALTSVSDSTMPGFEAPEPPVPVVTPADEPVIEESQAEPAQQEEAQVTEPELPPLPPLPPLPEPFEAPAVPEQPSPEFPGAPTEAPADPLAPAIINEHGSFTSEPPTQSQPLNGLMNDQNEAVPTVDLFGAPQDDTTQPSVAPAIAPPIEFATEPLVPEVQSPQGTPEGAAALGGTDEASAPEPQPVVDLAPPMMPPLPPLPPLPTDGSLPPLPPPPPLPDFNQPVAPLSGAVSGDVFGDTPAAPLEDTPSPAAPTPSEPGQFRIPGQA